MALDCSVKRPRPNGRAGVGWMPLGRRLGLNYHVNYASSRRPGRGGVRDCRARGQAIGAGGGFCGRSGTAVRAGVAGPGLWHEK